MPHGFDPDAERLPKGRKDPFDPFVQVHALTDEEYAAERSRTRYGWRPVTLRTPFLVAVISVTLGLIGVVQWLLMRSQTKQGIWFAPDVNDLPLKQSFLYLYLPTLLSVVYSFIWTWIDLDVKRLEPFLQLSRRGGASAEDSVLLHYPFDFLATVPLKALKRKHWSVFAASTIMVLIFWGLTPTQAGLFAVRTTVISSQPVMNYADHYTPVGQQGSVPAIYPQSVYNIAWLNESLPSFMTRDYVLEAFQPADAVNQTSQDYLYSGTTTLYSVDVDCETAKMWNNSGTATWNSSTGCSFTGPPYRIGGPYASRDPSKPYDATYVAHQDPNGNSDWYLDDTCQDSFFARWSKSTSQAIRSGEAAKEIVAGTTNATTLYCTTHYYQQSVNATISFPNGSVVSVSPTGSKQPMPTNLFNTTTFEWYITWGRQPLFTRGDYPTVQWPSQYTKLQNTPLDLFEVPQMAQFAIAAHQRPIEDFMDAKTMQEAYQAAFRLLFARQLVDILGTRYSPNSTQLGTKSYVTQAVVVVPGFAYAVTALLASVACLACWLLVYTMRRPNALTGDIASLASVMNLTEGSTELIVALTGVKQHSADALDIALRGRRFALESSHGQNRKSRCKIFLKSTSPWIKEAASSDGSSLSSQPSSVPAGKPFKGVRPIELRSAVGLVFLVLQLAALATLAYLYREAKTHVGLPLPSHSILVRQLVENYTLIAAATLMEPFWLVLNRLLCLLQPWEELRKGKAKASHSVELDYNSLPPQFVFWRAIKTKHAQLALVCLMTILANGLTVALGGILYEGNAVIPTSTHFNALYRHTLRPLNGTGRAFNAVTNDSYGSTTLDQFYRKTSNMTAHTPYPPWTDTKLAYLPVTLPTRNDSLTFNVSTFAIGADLQCQPLEHSGPASYNFTWLKDDPRIHISASVPQKDGTTAHCQGLDIVGRRDAFDDDKGNRALEFAVPLMNGSDVTLDKVCRQNLVAGWVRANLTSTGPSNHGYNYVLELADLNQSVILCTPKIVAGPANVVVTVSGDVVGLQSSTLHEMNGTQDLVAQANSFLVDNGQTWHNDSFPSDFVNYLMQLSNPELTLLNWELPPPSFSEAGPAFTALYNRLFPLLVGPNFNLLFETAPANTSGPGSILVPETRIFVSLPAFLVAEIILGLYVLVTIWLYLRRPWRILPRLPTTLASTIAYFAASNALRDLRVTEGKGEDTWKRWKWGYGFFVGTDGKAHLGVEREPLLMAVGKETEKGLPLCTITAPIRDASS